MQKILFLAVMSTCLLAWSAAALPPSARPQPAQARAEAGPSDPLAGATFTGEMGEKGKPASEKDTLTFKDGRFHSLGCDPWGFGAADYSVARSAGHVTFSAETTSAAEGRMSWRGELKGDRLEGTALWTKPGQAPAEYWFKARRQ